MAQQYAMRYGTLPIARKTGGLRDTIDDWNENAVSPTGFLFKDISEDSLRNAIERALKLFSKPEAIDEMRIAAMEKPSSWEKPAEQYVKVYQWALERARLGQGE